MKCKKCHRQIVDMAIFCPWCGERQVKEKLSIPKPTRLADGTYSGQIMLGGKRVRVKGLTEAQYEARARALKEGFIEDQSTGRVSVTLKEAIQSYMDKNSAILSPSTLRGYNVVLRNRFKNYMDKPVDKIDYQKMINDETEKVAPKTVINGWALAATSIKAAGGTVPEKLNKPAVPVDMDAPFLDEDQIKLFLEKLRGEEIEFVALAALHSLRESEILALRPGSVTKSCIKVRGAVVPDKNNVPTMKQTNKTKKSTRDIPILIPRILEVIPSEDDWHIPVASNILRDINRVCVKAGVPEVGCQGLRRTFAGMAYRLGWSEMHTMAVGGWTNTQTIHQFYLRLSRKEKTEDVTRMQEKYKELCE